MYSKDGIEIGDDDAQFIANGDILYIALNGTLLG